MQSGLFPHINGGIAVLAETGRTERRGTPSRQGALGRLRPLRQPGRYADGNGLYLFVQPTGTRSWVRRLVIPGRLGELGLGAAALVSLAEGMLANLIGVPLRHAAGTLAGFDHEQRRVRFGGERLDLVAVATE